VTELLWEDGRVVGARLVSAGVTRDVRARIVVGADGRNSFVAGAVNAPIEESEPGSRALYYRYVRGFAGVEGSKPDGPEFSLLEDEIAYVFPSEGGVTCVAVSINLDDFGRLRRSAEKGFGDHIAHHPAISCRLVSATEDGRLQASGPELNYVRVPMGPGWALVGDAGLHQDLFTGLGIDMASMHATFLAEALLSWFGSSASEEDALASYHRRRNEHALPGYHQTVALARDLRLLQS
jgi:flavin-dependent dehydrogenase